MVEEGDLIHRYTRAQALADGILIDVSSTAKEAGMMNDSYTARRATIRIPDPI